MKREVIKFPIAVDVMKDEANLFLDLLVNENIDTESVEEVREKINAQFRYMRALAERVI